LTPLRPFKAQAAGQPASCLLYCEHEARPAACAVVLQAVSTNVEDRSNEGGPGPGHPLAESVCGLCSALVSGVSCTWELIALNNMLFRSDTVTYLRV
jgi:hypothetical protein